MKILFFGDSITDAIRSREYQGDMISPYGIGPGYANSVASELVYSNADKYQIINTGISGNRVVDLYARIKIDCWNYTPDVISILIGTNDVWHNLFNNNGVEMDRYEKVYRTLIDDTKKALPNVKIILLEPFIQEGSATKEKYQDFLKVKEYAKVVKNIAKDYNLPFVELQKPLDDFAKKYGNDKTLIDGVHPAIGGAKVIANEWLKVFKSEVDV